MPKHTVASRRRIGALIALAAVALLVALAMFPPVAGATTGTLTITTVATNSGAVSLRATATDLSTGDTSSLGGEIQVARDVALVAGWNLVGWTGATPVREATASLGDALLAAFTWDASSRAFRSFSPTAPDFINSLNELALGDGVWANLSEAASWPQPPFAKAREVPLSIGFNLVMWTGPDDTPVADAIAAIAGSLDGLFLWHAAAQQFLTYRPTALAFLNTAATLRFGDGVWLRMTQAATWTQPALDGEVSPVPPVEEEPQPFALTSSAFAANEHIPAMHTCDGANTSPPLALTGTPSTAVTLALILDDPDAPGGTWVHWVAFNIPPTDEISADVALLGTSGSNSWDLTGYGGPCPPSGTHRYVFTVYALDSAIALGEGATKADLLSAIDGHVLGTAQLIGLFR